MRHHNQNRKLGRVRKQRRALLNSLARSLVLKEKVKTTDAKARELRPFIEKLVTAGKKGTVSARRDLALKVGPKAAKQVVDILAPKYKDRQGGYTRIVKMPKRLSDGSKMAIIEFVK